MQYFSALRAARPAPSVLLAAHVLFGLSALGLSVPAAAQESIDEDLSPAEIARQSQSSNETPLSRSRIYLGPQIGPAYPGASRIGWGPYADYSRARDDEHFVFEAPDESAGFTVFERHGSAVGLTANYLGRRKASDTDGLLSNVGRSFEFGLSGQTWVNEDIRLRVEARKAITGHKGFVGNIGADYVMQTGDHRLLSVGPRMSFGDGKFQRTYFGVTEAEALTSGLEANRPGGGLYSMGVAASYLVQLTPQWGLAAYGRFERLVGDAASSQVTREFGSRNQPSAGVAVSYTFNSRR